MRERCPAMPLSLCASPGVSLATAGAMSVLQCAREAAALSSSGMGTPVPSSMVCCGEPAQMPHSSCLDSGGPGSPEAAGSQARCPFAGAPHGLWDACGCSFAYRAPGRASLPPLHRQALFILVAAGAVGRLQEMRCPSLCCLLWLPQAEVQVPWGLVLVLGVSWLSGSWKC